MGRTRAVAEATITFERLGREHFELLGRWLAEPHVARWWNHDPSPAGIEESFGDTIDGIEPAEDYIAFVDGQPLGVIQFCLFHDFPEYVAEMADVYPVDIDAATIDYFIGEPDAVGKGWGTAMIEQFVARIWREAPAVGHVVVPVNSANVASWRALLNAGFRLVAQGEMDPDNPIDDRLHEILRIDRPPITTGVIQQGSDPRCNRPVCRRGGDALRERGVARSRWIPWQGDRAPRQRHDGSANGRVAA